MIKKCNKRIDMVVKLIFILIFVKQMRDIFTLIILKNKLKDCKTNNYPYLCRRNKLI
jgi:hypothetical protein